MSNAVKWALLSAGLISIVVIVANFGLLGGVAFIGESFGVILSLAGSMLSVARRILNNFLPVEGRVFLTGILFYIFFKWVLAIAVSITATVYHFIFRG